jgi:hypothetical protein
MVRVMVFNAAINNSSDISFRSVLLVEETESHWRTLSHNVVSSTPHLSGIRTQNVSGDRHWLHLCIHKYNYHTITVYFILVFFYHSWILYTFVPGADHAYNVQILKTENTSSHFTYKISKQETECSTHFKR